MPSLFTKAHYEAIAGLLRESPTLMEGERRSLIEEFADMLDADSELFVYGQFVAAATPDTPVPEEEESFGLVLTAFPSDDEEEPAPGLFEILGSITDVSPSAKHVINEILYSGGKK